MSVAALDDNSSSSNGHHIGDDEDTNDDTVALPSKTILASTDSAHLDNNVGQTSSIGDDDSDRLKSSIANGPSSLLKSVMDDGRHLAAGQDVGDDSRQPQSTTNGGGGGTKRHFDDGDQAAATSSSYSSSAAAGAGYLNGEEYDDLEDNEAPRRSKIGKFDKMSEEEILSRTLPDYLQVELDIVFIGINPGYVAAETGRYYAGSGNHFWKCMYASGLLPEALTSADDYRLPDFGIGLTNIVARTTRGSSDLKPEEIKDGSKSLNEKLKKYRCKIAVFNGMEIYRVYSGKKSFALGRQPERVADTDTAIFVMPSSSARCAQLPRAEDKTPYFTALRKLRDSLRDGGAAVTDDEVTFAGTLLASPKKTSPTNDDDGDDVNKTKKTNGVVFGCPAMDIEPDANGDAGDTADAAGVAATALTAATTSLVAADYEDSEDDHSSVTTNTSTSVDAHQQQQSRQEPASTTPKTDADATPPTTADGDVDMAVINEAALTDDVTAADVTDDVAAAATKEDDSVNAVPDDVTASDVMHDDTAAAPADEITNDNAATDDEVAPVVSTDDVTDDHTSPDKECPLPTTDGVEDKSETTVADESSQDIDGEQVVETDVDAGLEAKAIEGEQPDQSLAGVTEAPSDTDNVKVESDGEQAPAAEVASSIGDQEPTSINGVKSEAQSGGDLFDATKELQPPPQERINADLFPAMKTESQDVGVAMTSDAADVKPPVQAAVSSSAPAADVDLFNPVTVADLDRLLSHSAGVTVDTGHHDAFGELFDVKLDATAGHQPSQQQRAEPEELTTPVGETKVADGDVGGGLTKVDEAINLATTTAAPKVEVGGSVASMVADAVTSPPAARVVTAAAANPGGLDMELIGEHIREAVAAVVQRCKDGTQEFPEHYIRPSTPPAIRHPPRQQQVSTPVVAAVSSPVAAVVAATQRQNTAASVAAAAAEIQTTQQQQHQQQQQQQQTHHQQQLQQQQHHQQHQQTQQQLQLQQQQQQQQQTQQQVALLAGALNPAMYQAAAANASAGSRAAGGATAAASGGTSSTAGAASVSTNPLEYLGNYFQQQQAAYGNQIQRVMQQAYQQQAGASGGTQATGGANATAAQAAAAQAAAQAAAANQWSGLYDVLNANQYFQPQQQQQPQQAQQTQQTQQQQLQQQQQQFRSQQQQQQQQPQQQQQQQPTQQDFYGSYFPNYSGVQSNAQQQNFQQ